MSLDEFDDQPHHAMELHRSNECFFRFLTTEHGEVMFGSGNRIGRVSLFDRCDYFPVAPARRPIAFPTSASPES